MKVDFNKTGGLVPVIVQNYLSSKVLMLGYMNNEALEKTVDQGLVTFFSRSKNRLWTKGETSGNFLKVKEIKTDCDNDTLLILAEPSGSTCHTGDESCFGDQSAKGFLYKLEEKIRSRIDENSENSYTNNLYKKGINKIAQKVGEEAVELVIEAKDNNIELFKNEAADLLYHLLILLKAKNIKLEDIEEILRTRDRC
ncbi:MAG: bifunctional phosphoribosyl-AMP cyclohydrolase/phosphoribosyl-ATP diphosphatase HisIE [Bacteroidales bacterium]|nr:bifunctional phosphoribosyl-AMP cyclohydrolase/phosphoribosyl-ATP diphosphatase HisIE [Bacteroidales bacterium]